MDIAGKLKIHSSQEIEQSYVSIGFEMLDRDMFDPERCYDLIENAGIKYARCQTGWAKTEKEKGVYDFKWLDEIIDNLIHRGIIPWFSVGYGNPIYMENIPNETAVGCVPTLYGDECKVAWNTYVCKLAEHFKGRVEYFEIWNESDTPAFWHPKAPDGKEYAELVKLTSQNILKYIPEAKIGVCIASPKNLKYVDALFRTLKEEQIDFLAYHIYTVAPEKMYFDIINKLRQRLDLYGFQSTELWQGEGGYPSWAYKGHWLVNEGCNSEHAQAVWQIRRYFLDVYAGVKLCSFFQAVDIVKTYKTAIAEMAEPAKHGIIDGKTYKPKESYKTISNLSSIFSGNIKKAGYYFDGYLHKGTFTERFLCMYLTYEKNNIPVYAYYHTSSVSEEADLDTLFNAIVEVMPENPVLVDPYTGIVRRITKFKDIGNGTEIYDLPIKNYPLIITDEQTFEYIPE